jgi:hypothetical protein
VKKQINQADDEISRIFNDADVVTSAIQAGINAALLKHKQSGNPICVWRDGKVVWIAPENIKIKAKE